MRDYYFYSSFMNMWIVITVSPGSLANLVPPYAVRLYQIIACSFFLLSCTVPRVPPCLGFRHMIYYLNILDSSVKI